MSQDNDQTEQIERIPAHPPVPEGFRNEAPPRFILMSPAMIMIGSLIAFFTGAFIVVLLPQLTYNPPPSQNWVPLSAAAHNGRAIYLANGCFYCHSYFTRPDDTFTGQYYLYPRTSEPGDYQGERESPNIFGTERTGPDLSQEGGMHPDDWQNAHYDNPRWTNPLSIMPVFSYLSQQERVWLLAFIQTSGGKEGILRYAAVDVAGRMMLTAMGMKDVKDTFPDLYQQLQASGDYNANGKPSDESPSGLSWKDVYDLNSRERGYWLTVDPVPVTQNNLMRGKEIFLQRCSGCHGLGGAGDGPGARLLMPPPANFSASNAQGVEHGAPSGPGSWYYRILTAGKGTAMENFGTRLSVEDIWRVVLFLRTINKGTLEPKGVVPTPKFYEPWTPPQELLNYIDAHPIEAAFRPFGGQGSDPFMTAAYWMTPGMAPQDTIMVAGQFPLDQALMASLIKDRYQQIITEAYNDATAAGEEVPPLDQLLDTSGVVWHEPAG